MLSEYGSTHSITFMQYNMGSGIGDTENKYTDDELRAKPITDVDYHNYAAQRNEGLLKVADKIDVFFLEERLLEPMNLELIKGLKAKGFQVFHASMMKPDCVIAIRETLFERAVEDPPVDIKETLFAIETVAKNNSRFEESSNTDFAIIRTTHKPTGLPLTLASAHIEGFPLDTPKESLAEVAKNGDGQTHLLVNTLLKDVSDLTIVGCDLNSQRTVYDERHEIFTQAGYTEHRSFAETALFKQSAVTPMRWLDYFFVRNLSSNSLFQKIKSLFFSTISTQFRIENIREIHDKFNADWDWSDLTKNSSDHMPIVGTLQITTQNSKLYDASMAIYRFIKSLWPF